MAKSENYITQVYDDRLALYTNQYVALFDGDPTDSGTSLQDELTGGTTLVAIGTMSVVSFKLQNNNEIELTASADASGTADYIAIYAADAVDPDDLIDYQELDPPISWNAGDKVIIPATELKIVET